MKIKSIYINGLHNAVDRTYDMGDLNYLIGHNGAGKSTVLQAIQFALLGYIPGTAKNSKEAFLRHSPTGEIHVRLALSDLGRDVLIERKLNAKSNTLSVLPEGYEIAHIVADIELPIFNFNEFVSQTANKLKEYFIKNLLPTVDGSLDWEKILTESILDCNFNDRAAIVDYGMKLVRYLDGEILGQVIRANAKFVEEQSYNKAELKRLQSTVDSLIYYEDYTGPSDMTELNAQLLTANAQRDQLIKYNSAINATKSMSVELETLRNRVEELGGIVALNDMETKLPEIQKQINDVSIMISNKTKESDALNLQIGENHRVISGGGVCPYTKFLCAEIADHIPTLKTKNEGLETSRNALMDELGNLNGQLYKLNSQYQEYANALRNMKNIQERIKVLEQTLSDVPERPVTDKDVFTLDQEIAALNQSKEKLQANIKYNETIESFTKRKFEVELQLKALNNWVKATDTNGLQTTLMIAPFDELANTMTGYIQKMYGSTDIKAHFNISSKANSFSFGLIRNEVYIPYDLLSSGEKCLYTLALMICITNTNKSPLRLLLCDDMFDHLDSAAIESTFIALQDIPDIQFIFAGVKECKSAEPYMIRV